MWREEFRKKFSGLHNVKSWAYEECDCNESTKKCIEKVEAFIDNQLTSLGQAMVSALPDMKIEQIIDGVPVDTNEGYNEALRNTHSRLTAELSKRGINLPK